MTRLRARVAERLKGAQNTYAMLTTFNEIDMTNIVELREQFKVHASSTLIPPLLISQD
jgi:2-oxoglutarate dehydrogenase E2 component (dihydrolipoamide succinyltransferase)